MITCQVSLLHRIVYKWFLLIYKVSYTVGIMGYILMMATFLGLYLFFGVKPQAWMDNGILMMFYALYYGVMARDFAEICTEKMVSRIGVSLAEGREVYTSILQVFYFILHKSVLLSFPPLLFFLT